MEARKESTDPPQRSREEIWKEIVARIDQRGTTQQCAVCGVRDWQIGYYVPLGASNSPSNQVLGGRVYPFVTIFCKNCGNTHFLNLLTLGFTEQDWQRLTLPE